MTEEHVDQISGQGDASEESDDVEDDALVVSASSTNGGTSITMSISWTYYALAVVIGLMILDYSVMTIGNQFFWSQRFIYISSMIIRCALLIIVTIGFKRFVFASRQTAYVVTMSIGFFSGLILAIMRFIGDSSFWTFLNLVAEPIDFSLIGLAAGYIAYNLIGTLTPVTKKTYE